jgi:Ser/Thr protein kinase RdoA (MazF antagonist)
MSSSANEMFLNRLDASDVLTSLEKLGLEPTGTVLPLNSLENRVFFVPLEAESINPLYPTSKESGGNVIIKFYRPGRWSKDQIQEEHDFLKELFDLEISVIAPFTDKDGKSIFELNDIFYTVWPNQKGRLVEEIPDDEMAVLGRLLARIHNLGASHQARHRKMLNSLEYGIKPLSYLLDEEWIPISLRNRYESAVKEIIFLYDTISKDIPVHRIHGDCHKGNLIKTSDGFAFIDFDDFVMGPAIQDLWMLLPFGDEKADQDRELFLSGYREFREFHDSWFDLVEPLRGLRYVHYSAWIAYRWKDPAFPQTFPHFGSDDYWEGETRDLETLLRGIHEGRTIENNHGLSSNQKKQDDDLTNKDFFWDLE